MERKVMPNTYTDGRVVEDSYVIEEDGAVVGELTWVRPGFWNCLYWDEWRKLHQEMFATEAEGREWALSVCLEQG